MLKWQIASCSGQRSVLALDKKKTLLCYAAPLKVLGSSMEPRILALDQCNTSKRYLAVLSGM